MERKLATIREVSGIRAIQGADNIEIAQVDGWQCVVKKGEFVAGDLAAYFEIDSFLPIEPRYEFLRKSSFRTLEDGTEGFRLKTIRLRKELSQGLLLPLSAFPEIKKPREGQDVTDLLKVTKYEPPTQNVNIPSNRKLTTPQKIWKWIKPFVPSVALKYIYKYIPSFLDRNTSAFPSFIRKTDQERIQNMLWVLTEHWNTPFEITQKLDGSSMTAYQYKGKFGVCSRNIALSLNKGGKFVEKAKQGQFEAILKHLCKDGRNLAIQGELCGPGIQNNYEQIPEIEFFLFDIFDIDKQRYLTGEERRALYTNSLGVRCKVVPAGDEPCTLKDFLDKHGFTESKIEEVVLGALPAIIPPDVDADKLLNSMIQRARLDALLLIADRKSVLNPNVNREGLVFKSVDLMPNGQVLSFKVISNSYLEKEK